MTPDCFWVVLLTAFRYTFEYPTGWKTEVPSKVWSIGSPGTLSQTTAVQLYGGTMETKVGASLLRIHDYHVSKLLVKGSCACTAINQPHVALLAAL